jgi:hypothetical protein
MGGRAGVILDRCLVVLITLPNAGKMRLETTSETAREGASAGKGDARMEKLTMTSLTNEMLEMVPSGQQSAFHDIRASQCIGIGQGGWSWVAQAKPGVAPGRGQQHKQRKVLVVAGFAVGKLLTRWLHASRGWWRLIAVVPD